MQEPTSAHDFNSRVGNRIRELREERKWSQRHLAEVLAANGVKIDPSAVTRIERGQREIKLHEASALASALRVKVDELLKHDDDDPRRELTDTIDWVEEQILRAQAGLTALAFAYTSLVQLLEQHPDLIDELTARAGSPVIDSKQYLALEVSRIAEGNPKIRIAVDEVNRDMVSQILSALATNYISPEDPEDDWSDEGADDDSDT